MKKKLLLLCAIFISTFTFAQTVFTEDFEGGTSIPAGWTNNDIQGGGDVWTFENTGEASLAADGNQLIYDLDCAGIYAAFDSDEKGDNGIPENAALESPAFDCSVLTSVTLSFTHAFAGNYGGSGFVEVKNGDDPSNDWVNVATYTEDNYQGGLVEIDVTNELADVSNAQVRFRWTGDFSVAWYFDNVEVFECTETAPGNDVTAISPADGANDVEILYGDTNSVSQIEWTDPTTGGTVNGYDLSLGVTATGDDIGTVESFESGNGLVYDFQPNTTYYWKVTSKNCAANVDSPVFSFTTEACNETSAPAAASVQFPADGATDVEIDGNNSIDFTFNSPAGANTVLLFGTTNPPTQTFNDFNSGETFGGLQLNTEYFWAIDTYNCVGSTSGTVWSFTTGDTLSADDFEQLVNFEFFIENGLLTITANQSFDQINIFDLSGKQIMNKELSSNDENISLQGLANGLYLAKVQIGEETKTFKFIK